MNRNFNRRKKFIFFLPVAVLIAAVLGYVVMFYGIGFYLRWHMQANLIIGKRSVYLCCAGCFLGTLIKVAMGGIMVSVNAPGECVLNGIR